MRERGIFSFSKENSSFFAQVRMSMRHKCRVMRPPFSFPRKKTGGVTVQKKGVSHCKRAARRAAMLADCTALCAALLYDLTCSYHPLLRSRWRLCCLTDMACPLRVLRRRTQLPAPPPAGGHPRRARVRGDQTRCAAGGGAGGYPGGTASPLERFYSFPVQQ